MLLASIVGYESPLPYRPSPVSPATGPPEVQPQQIMCSLSCVVAPVLVRAPLLTGHSTFVGTPVTICWRRPILHASGDQRTRVCGRRALCPLHVQRAVSCTPRAMLVVMHHHHAGGVTTFAPTNTYFSSALRLLIRTLRAEAARSWRLTRLQAHGREGVVRVRCVSCG